MVDQLSSILAMRLRDLLIFRLERGGGGGAEEGQGRFGSDPGIMAMTMSYLRLDSLLGDYVLNDSILKSIRSYVTTIGKLYNHVGFHSFEHAAHVTISMNKLLFMLTGNSNFRDNMVKRRTSELTYGGVIGGGRGGNHDHRVPGDRTNVSYGIGEDPRVLFAMVFSSLIHDVGHTGVPNSVLVDEEDELAILHNDVSVAEANSLQVAFSILQKDEFAQLKRCISPTPQERKFFRKKVICMVMVTDISDQERIQIVASRWNAAFPKKDDAVDPKKDEDGGVESSNNGTCNTNGNNSNGGGNGGTNGGNNGGNNSNNNSREQLPSVQNNANNSIDKQREVVGGEQPRPPPTQQQQPRPRLPNRRTISARTGNNARSARDIQSPELRASLTRRRFTMFTTDAAAEEFEKKRNNRGRRLGIRTSMDFSGMLIDAYRTMDQLQQHAVLETMMNVADVAHTMQSFSIFCKWNRRLYKEFYVAHLNERLSFDPEESWYENQIGFFSHYILPLAGKMKTCGVFSTTGNVFEYFAMENKKRWIEEGEVISEEIIRDVKKEVEREQRLANGTLSNGCH